MPKIGTPNKRIQIDKHKGNRKKIVNKKIEKQLQTSLEKSAKKITLKTFKKCLHCLDWKTAAS